MKIAPFALTAAMMLLTAPAAHAALAVGAIAPDFTTEGAIAGKSFAFSLAKVLKKGPVVLYFYPKAFTQGCTLEAHAFADKVDDFRKAGATVIGVSGDGIEELKRFSREACRDKFAVVSATPRVIGDYDVSFKGKPELSDRTSYVIAKNGRITYVHSDLDYKDHVAKTLAAVEQMGTQR